MGSLSSCDGLGGKGEAIVYLLCGGWCVLLVLEKAGIEIFDVVEIRKTGGVVNAALLCVRCKSFERKSDCL